MIMSKMDAIRNGICFAPALSFGLSPLEDDSLSIPLPVDDGVEIPVDEEDGAAFSAQYASPKEVMFLHG
jgi:hypothetical protein